jgi:hypothetical protein
VVAPAASGGDKPTAPTLAKIVAISGKSLLCSKLIAHFPESVMIIAARGAQSGGG